MNENIYITELLDKLGFAINEKNNSEIILNYLIKFNKKNLNYCILPEYKINLQKLGTFMADFLNVDFNNFDDFFNFFLKYPLILLEYNRLFKLFKNNTISETELKSFISDLLNKNKKDYIKFQKQTDMIIDYCITNPTDKALKFTSIERLYVLRRIDPALTLLNENKAGYYSINLFSSYPGDSEKEIYNFLEKKNNSVIDYDLIIPYTISSIIYKSLSAIMKEKVYLKSCKNCNRYFIAEKKLSLYCNNIAPFETKRTCRQIGRKRNFEENISNDKVLNLYYQIYSRKAMMKSRNPDIQVYIDDFNKYKTTGKKKLEKYKSGKITSGKFKEWIEKQI